MRQAPSLAARELSRYERCRPLVSFLLGRGRQQRISFMRSAIAALTCAAFLVAGCQTQNAYSGEQQTSNATRGAVAGAAGGALIGALTNTSHGNQAARNALIGAGIGALAGAAIGHYMDDEEAALRERMRPAGVSVTRQGDRIILDMASDVTFDTDRDQVKPQFYQVLAAV